MYYRCPICNGSGTVEPGFGGGVAGDTTAKKCPGCKGTGMQYEREPEQHTTIIRKRNPCNNAIYDFMKIPPYR